MDDGAARRLKKKILDHLAEIERASLDLVDGGWSAQIFLMNEVDQKVAYINLGDISTEDFLGVNIRYDLE